MKAGQEPPGLSDDRGNVIRGPKFTIGYDKLVIAVGAYAQSMYTISHNAFRNSYINYQAFGIPGVKEHAFFLKDVRDARAIRTRILECG